MFDFNATKKRIIDERWPHHRDSSPDYPDSSWSEGQLGWKVALHRYSVFEHMIETRGSRNPAKLGSDWLSVVTKACYRHRNSIVSPCLLSKIDRTVTGDQAKTAAEVLEIGIVGLASLL